MPLLRIIPDEVVTVTGQFIKPRDLRIGIGIQELHTHGGSKGVF